MPTDFRFIFLGTGTSGGVPQIACDCEVCTSIDPRDTRTRTGAAIQFVDDTGQERTILIDATPDLRQQALRHNLWRCDAILFTHNHVDHIFGLDEVRRFNAVMQAPIDIYADDHTMESLFRVYKHIFEKEKNWNDSFVATLLPMRLELWRPVDLFGVRFTPIRLLHGKQPIMGFRVEEASSHRGIEPSSGEGSGEDTGDPSVVLPLAYCTDVSGIPPESWPYLEGLRTLVLDGLRLRHHPTHFNLERAVQHALQIGAEQTWLVHIAHEILHAREDPKLPEGINLAWDGLVLGKKAPGQRRIKASSEEPGDSQSSSAFNES